MKYRIDEMKGPFTSVRVELRKTRPSTKNLAKKWLNFYYTPYGLNPEGDRLYVYQIIKGEWKRIDVVYF